MNEGRSRTRCSDGDDNDGSFFRPLVLLTFTFSLYPLRAQLTRDDYKWDLSHMAGAATKPWYVMGSSYIRAKASGIQPENHGFLAAPAKSNGSNL